MQRVLFVCLGNICRSPMAEALFRDKVKRADLDQQLSCDSAGTGGWHAGEPPHEGTRRILTQHGIDFSGIVARQLTRDDLTHFDYILTMDGANLTAVRRLGTTTALVRPLMDYAPHLGYSEVPDPWYDGNFALTYRLLEAACEGFLGQVIGYNAQ